MPYKFHSLCVRVPGFLRTAVYDLQYGKYYVTYEDFSKISDEETLAMLLEHNLIYYPDRDESTIKPISLDVFDHPSEITNAIVEVDTDVNLNIIIDNLENTLCQFVLFVLKPNVVRLEVIERIKASIRSSNVLQCELVIPYDLWRVASEKLEADFFQELGGIIVYHTPSGNYEYKGIYKVSFTNQTYSYKPYEISQDSFIINSWFYVESLSYNTYYNRKIFIDSSGGIKNGPNTSDVIGSIYSSKWSENIINDKRLVSLWSVKKDQISICNVCEFRHMCMDARVPVQHANKREWYHTNECNYNPYLAKWKHEEGYKTLLDSGVMVTKVGVEIDEEKLKNAISDVYY